MILSIFRIILTIAEVLLIFNLLIIVHELGHFLAARWRGLQVEKFGIWFGRPIWKKNIRGVEYSLGCIPAGGFVLLPQMAPMQTVEGKSTTDRDTLSPAKPLDKIIVAFAGPLFSFLLALAFAVIVWAVGRPTAQADATTTVGYVIPGDPAEKAGFKPGDVILSVDNHPVSRFAGMVDSVTWYVVRSEGETIAFKIRRGNQILTLHSGYTRPQTTGWERKPLRQVGIAPAITPIVFKVIDGSVAAKAGIQPNDEIVSVGGKKLYHPQHILEWEQANPGKPLPLTILRDGKTIELTMAPSRTEVSSVIRNSPADVAGIRAGDRILALDGTPIYDQTEIIKRVEAGPKTPLSLTIENVAGQQRTVRVLPATPDGQNRPIIGIGFAGDSDGILWDGSGTMTVVHISPVEQIYSAVETIGNTIGALLSAHSDIKLQHMSGPIMIMQTYYRLFESDYGWQMALWFSVVFNVNLALINLLPIPVLDGGHIVLAAIEGIRRRPINLRVLEVVQTGCALLLIGFMIYVSFYDAQDLPWNNNHKVKFSVPARPAPPENQ
ncbi:MAG TPA: site-2 protease family protein [Chthoniobacterales bacterium]|nr:site-2 protease family protein [Chthoniobacterales bacterium]